MAAGLDVFTNPCAYSVTCIAEECIDQDVLTIRVEYAGHDRWAVRLRSWCLDAAGEWDHELQPSSRTDEWLATHRFPLDDALARARAKAPGLTLNGLTVQEVIDHHAKAACR